MIVCECTGTSDRKIRALAEEGVTKVSEVTRRCGAGGCCQSCRPAIARILRQVAAERESEGTAPVAAAVAQASSF